VTAAASTLLEHLHMWIVDYILVLFSLTEVIMIHIIILFMQMIATIILFMQMITTITVVEPILSLLNRRVMPLHNLLLSLSMTLIQNLNHLAILLANSSANRLDTLLLII